MKNWVLIISLILSSQILEAQSTLWLHNQYVYHVMNDDLNIIYSNSFDAATIENLTVRNPKGSINIFGSSSGSQIEIKVFKKKSFSFIDRSDEGSDQIKSWVSGNSIHIETADIDAKNHRFIDAYVFEIRLPSRINLSAESNHGEIYIEGLSSELAVACSYGDLYLKKIIAKSKSRFKAFHGDINIQNYQGFIMAKTKHGDIRIDSLDAEIRMKSNYGNIIGERLKGSILCRSENGNIDLEVLAFEQVMNLGAKSGNLIINSFSRQGIDLSMKGSQVSLINAERTFEGEKSSAFINGTLNGGGIPVILSSEQGNVVYIIKDPSD